VPPFQKEKLSYTYMAGFKKYPTWQLEGGVKKWVEGMPANILSQQLPITPPIFINRDLVDAFFRQRAAREHKIRQAREDILSPLVNQQVKNGLLDEVFPQHFEECSPAWGDGCPYKKLCHGNVADPLKVGFDLRHSHHQIEEDQLNDAGAN
jgi:hypothetical protein